MCLYTTLHHHKQNLHRHNCNHRYNHNPIKNNRPKYSIHIQYNAKISKIVLVVDKTLFAEFHQEFNPFLNDLKKSIILNFKA